MRVRCCKLHATGLHRIFPCSVLGSYHRFAWLGACFAMLCGAPWKNIKKWNCEKNKTTLRSHMLRAGKELLWKLKVSNPTKSHGVSPDMRRSVSLCSNAITYFFEPSHETKLRHYSFSHNEIEIFEVFSGRGGLSGLTLGNTIKLSAWAISIVSIRECVSCSAMLGRLFDGCLL